jgi:hypothetical protein
VLFLLLGIREDFLVDKKTKTKTKNKIKQNNKNNKKIFKKIKNKKPFDFFFCNIYKLKTSYFTFFLSSFLFLIKNKYENKKKKTKKKNNKQQTTNKNNKKIF